MIGKKWENFLYKQTGGRIIAKSKLLAVGNYKMVIINIWRIHYFTVKNGCNYLEQHCDNKDISCEYSCN